MILKKLTAMAAVLADAAFIWNVPKVNAFDERAFIDRCGSRYGYEFLGTTENGEAKQRLYDDLYERCCEIWSSDKDISEEGHDSPLRISMEEYGLTLTDFTDVGEMFIDDNRMFYFFDHYNISSAEENGKETVTYHIYEDYTRETVRTAARDDIYRYVTETAAQLDKMDMIFYKVKFLHNKINDNTEYEYEYGLPSLAAHAHNILGIIQDGSAVCEGYASCFSVVMNYADVECYYVGGLFDKSNHHAWNEVKLDDGKYYSVDCTADDMEDFSKYTFLAVGKEKTSMTDKPDTPDERHPYIYHYMYPLPELSDKDFICKGDVDLNGKVDIVDAVLTISYINGNYVLEGHSFFGADINNDDKVDIADAVYIIRHLTGEIVLP